MASTQESDWSIRAYQHGDERQLVDLFARVFGRSISEAHWLWKLKAHTAPVENVWLALDDNGPIFQYAGIPMRYRLPDGEKLAMVSVDTMTAPDYQRRGLLTQIGRYTYDRWREAGVSFVIGLPNERWGSRTTALGWTKLFRLQWMVRVLRPEAVLARRLRLPIISGLTAANALWNAYSNLRIKKDRDIRIHEIVQDAPQIDALWQAIRHDQIVSPIRDSAWLNWRYLSAPMFDYHVLLAEQAGEPVGYVVYRLVQRARRLSAFIVELTVRQDIPGVGASLTRHVLDVMRDSGVEVVRSLAVPGTATHKAFRQAAFFGRASFSVELVPLDPELPLDVLRDPQNWNICGGDFDVI